MKLRVLIIGASYGLLPAAKIAAAGHAVCVIGRADEVAQITRDGVAIQFSPDQILRPPMGPGGLTLATPDVVEPTDYDLVILAIQEPQVHNPEIEALLNKIGDRLPVASIMTMPPPPFLARIPALPEVATVGAYQDAKVWEAISPDRITLASPDPQAFRPDPDRTGLLQVTLTSNFKFAPFADAKDQAILATVARDASRVVQPWGRPPVHLLARGSVYTPLSKWPMLVTGNCRCVQAEGDPIAICDAVDGNVEESRMLYNAVNDGLLAIGAPQAALVPFDSYAKAAEALTRPSSLARGLSVGATAVERIDVLVLNFLQAIDADAEVVDMLGAISARIAKALALNRAAH